MYIWLCVCATAKRKELNNEMEKDITFEHDLRDAVGSGSLPRRYYRHSRVVGAAAGEFVAPYGIFIDGAKYKRGDSVVAIWFFSLITRLRHLIVVIKKAQVCKCACRGWCTWHRAFVYLAWAMEAMQRGVFPERRHDGTEWDDGDPNAALAGTRMVHPCVCIYFKADWGEYAPTIGLPAWSAALYPCKDCHVDQEQLCHVDRSCADQFPFTRTTGDDYEAACRLCERRVVIVNRAAHIRIVANLFFDKRDHGNAGRCLRLNMPEFGLLKGDRLEPSTYTPDILAFDDWNDGFPRTVLFWRSTRQTMTRHRNPIFDVDGVSHDVIVIDILHSVFLGVAQVWILGAFWNMMDENVYNVTATDRGTVNLLTVARIKYDLGLYYSRMRKTKQLSEVDSLTLSMISPRGSTGCFKGAETKHLIDFVVELLQRHGFAHRALLESGLHLQRYVRMLEVVGNNPDETQSNDLLYHAVMHMALATEAGLAATPKYHQFLHLAWDTYMNGNPNVYASWVDESLNKNLTSICAVAHSQVWAPRIFTWWKKLSGSQSWLAPSGRG